MAVSAESVPRRYTYEDLAKFPDDHLRREIIDGELYVSPSPSMRHQRASIILTVQLYGYAESTGGQAYAAPCDVKLDQNNAVVPDVFVVRQDHLDRIKENYLEGPPDLVVEISSPSTRRVDLKQKLALYERSGVGTYWFVDLKADHVRVYTLGESGYGEAQIRIEGETVEAGGLPGLVVPVSTILGL